MVLGMATVKVTVTLDEAQLRAVRAKVRARHVANVSAFVRKAVENLLMDSELWAAHLERSLAESGGPPTKDQIEWADRVLSGGGEQIEHLPRARPARRARVKQRAA